MARINFVKLTTKFKKNDVLSDYGIISSKNVRNHGLMGATRLCFPSQCFSPPSRSIDKNTLQQSNKPAQNHNPKNNRVLHLRACVSAVYFTVRRGCASLTVNEGVFSFWLWRNIPVRTL